MHLLYSIIEVDGLWYDNFYKKGDIDMGLAVCVHQLWCVKCWYPFKYLDSTHFGAMFVEAFLE
jgi:hypothetical protein